ncbi:MAG: glutamine--tRNA ligase/YqeY domain fusion protein [SAR202 cluster bacterium]|nr:glutamine--tRNA ligase/YqeY domain fusion protein [SAR202 cluster bacterium]
MTTPAEEQKLDFIRELIADDLTAKKLPQGVITRFPPEPNGYLHIGHAKSICLNFGVAQEFDGRCHLRFDDTNPSKEDDEYVESIKKDIAWLGWDWGEHLHFASDYFDALCGYAESLIQQGKAYVDDLTQEEIRAGRGTLTSPGQDSPYRERSVEENLDLFQRMHDGEFPEGARVLRAKIDMTSGNINMRDPVLYRIVDAPHHRTGTKWHIYPMYDFGHGQSDSIEGITHSLCTMEFEDHRPLYDWVLDTLGLYHPQQIEFARLKISYTILSKRKLLQLVTDGHVSGWDDPRMPTISGLRRRGYPAAAIRNFCDKIGIAKRPNTVELALLEHSVRDYLNQHAPRVLGVLRPLKVIIDNYPEGQSEELEGINNPEDPEAGTRKVPFSGELYIEQDDFMEDPPGKYNRLAPGREVRLRYGYFVTCVGVDKDTTDTVTAIHCTYDPETRGGQGPDGRKVRGTIHWVSAAHSIPAEVRLYEPLFSEEHPDDAEDFLTVLNPDSLDVVTGCQVEASLKDAAPGDIFQFERLGYFCVDEVDSKPGTLVFNRTVPLRDTWARPH